MVDLGAWLEVEVGEALGWTPLRMSALKMTSEREEVGVGQLALIMGCWGPSIVSPLGVKVSPLVEGPGEDLLGGPSYVEVHHFL